MLNDLITILESEYVIYTKLRCTKSIKLYQTFDNYTNTWLPPNFQKLQ